MKTIKILFIISAAMLIGIAIAFVEYKMQLPIVIVTIPNMFLGGALGVYALIKIINVLEQ